MFTKTLPFFFGLILLVGCNPGPATDPYAEALSKGTIQVLEEMLATNYVFMERSLVQDPRAATPFWDKAQEIRQASSQFSQELDQPTPELGNRANAFRTLMNTAVEAPFEAITPTEDSLISRAITTKNYQALGQLLLMMEWRTSRHLLGQIPTGDLWMDRLDCFALANPAGYAQGEPASVPILVAGYSTTISLGLVVGTDFDTVSQQLVDPDDSRFEQLGEFSAVRIDTKTPGIHSEMVQVNMPDPRGDTLTYLVPLVYTVLPTP